jgi:hypothetical protein
VNSFCCNDEGCCPNGTHCRTFPWGTFCTDF